ncbi:hypothetical protein BX600DRAFT_518962 [Xylariales sp. PMI_506]|nr:hypothetical protein BX600DRAFT_518962 [Xylariales sp. PMI_506]
MSWTKPDDPYGAFRQSVSGSLPAPAGPPWCMEVWESRDATLKGTQMLHSSFAPLDLARREVMPQMLRFFEILAIPGDFTTERVQSVSHSFGARTEDNGNTSVWFHFLCKNIELKISDDGSPVVDNQAAKMGHYTLPVLPQADYSWHRSGFLLSTCDGAVTLVCFGATPRVRAKLVDFLKGRDWHMAIPEPFILFDIILSGLFLDIDNTLWSMHDVFGPLEHKVLTLANSKHMRSLTRKINFTEMHNCAKHIIHIAEAIDSTILVLDKTCARLGLDTPQNDHVRHQLRDALHYRRSLFQSTKLRQASLQKRIDNAITLSFNLVTQQDSMVMIQDSNSMKVIAAITMVFLPTTTVAAVVGSQIFTTQKIDEEGTTWAIEVTPLFQWLWWISIPMTAIVGMLAFLWHYLTHREPKQPPGVKRMKLISSLSTSSSAT